MTELQRDYQCAKIIQAVVNNGQQSAIALVQNKVIVLFQFKQSNYTESLMQFCFTKFVCGKKLSDRIKRKEGRPSSIPSHPMPWSKGMQSNENGVID